MIQPIRDIGEVAKTATPILILNIDVGSIASLLLVIPILFMSKIEEFIYENGASIDIDVYRKFSAIMLMCNILLIVFDFLTVKSYLDFVNAFVK